MRCSTVTLFVQLKRHSNCTDLQGILSAHSYRLLIVYNHRNSNAMHILNNCTVDAKQSAISDNYRCDIWSDLDKNETEWLLSKQTELSSI